MSALTHALALMAGGAAGFLAAAILGASSYDRGFHDGADKVRAQWRRERDKEAGE